MIDRTMKSLFSTAAGLPVVLWFIVAYIITDVPQGGDGDVIMLIGVVLTGVALQLGMYALSNRPFLTVDRSPVFIWTVLVLATIAGLAVLAGVAWDLYVYRHPPATGIDYTPLVLSTCMAALLLSSGFRSRLRLIRMRTDYRSTSRVARQASRLVVPIGSFSMDRIITTLEDMANRPGQSAQLARRLDEFVDEFRLRGDSRYGRSVPWASAVCLVEAYVQMRADRAVPTGPVVTAAPIVFQREEAIETIRIRPALICSLLDVVAPESEPNEHQIVVRSMERDDKLVIQISGITFAHRRLHGAAREVNLALESGIVIDRLRGENGTAVLEITCPPMPVDGRFDWSKVNLGEEQAQVLSNSRFSNGVKQSFRCNGLVLRAQRLDLIDPKPTLIEDEFLIMRRLMDASPAFPRVVGFGTKDNVQWLSYRFEAGKPLGEWLESESNQKQWFRIIADVDHMIRIMRENTVAHRDLNPGNVIVRTDGTLALIDFDQAVADDRRFALADVSGGTSGLGKNDIGMFIERCELTRKANHAIQSLGEAWQKLLSRKTQPHTFIKSPYEFDFAGQTFPGWVPWYEEWNPLATVLGNIRGKRILNLGGGIGLLDTYLALGGADVTTVEAHPELLDAAGTIAEAAQVTVRFDPAAAQTAQPAQFDLVIAIGSGLEHCKVESLAETMKDQAQVLMEITGSLQDARKSVEDMGWVWRGVAAYTPRLCPLVAAVNPKFEKSADWLKVKQDSREAVLA